MQDLYKQLQAFGKVKANEALAKHTTFKIGGPADLFVSVTETEQLVALLRFLDGNGTPYIILGGGSNMLAADDGFRGVIIEVKTSGITIDGDVVEAAAGEQTVVVARESVKAGLAGFEWGVGVPGTIGGALRGNAGAMGKEMKDDVLKAEVYRDGDIIELTNQDLGFGYRHSDIKANGGVVLRVWLKLTPSDSSEGMKKALAALDYRNKTQPKGFASTGCIFKNIDIAEDGGEVAKKNKALLLKHFDEADEKVQAFLNVGKISAGWLVEQVGLKGCQEGHAEVSPVHGNFIVSLDKDATAADVKTLIEKIKEQVYTRYGFTLEEEIYLLSG